MRSKAIIWIIIAIVGVVFVGMALYLLEPEQPLPSDITLQDKTSHTTLNNESSDPALQTEHSNYHNLIRTNLINSLTYLFC